MFIYLSKLLPLFVYPLGLSCFALLLACICYVVGLRKLTKGLIVLALVVLYASSLPFTASTLYGNLERKFPPVPLENIPSTKCGVVLGGIIGQPYSPRVQAELYGGIDRAYMAYQLYKAGKIETMVISAGNLPWAGSVPPESELIREFLMALGVPKAIIYQDSSSANTYENGVNAGALLNRLNCGKALLITSAAHMPRAIAVFRKAGQDVFPVSVDVAVTNGDENTIMHFLPDVAALNLTTLAVKEYLGMLVYRIRGWV